MKQTSFNPKSPERKSFLSSSIQSVPFQLLPRSTYPPEMVERILNWQEAFSNDFESTPSIGICLIVEDSNRESLEKIFDSFSVQSYRNFSLHLVVKSEDDLELVNKLLLKASFKATIYQAEKDSSYLQNLRELFSEISAEYLLHFYGERLLHPQALFAFFKVIVKESPSLLYSNELIADASWTEQVEYYRKATVDKYTLLSLNTAGSGLLLSKSIAKVFAEDKAFDAHPKLIDWEIASRAFSSKKQVSFVPLGLFVTRTRPTVDEQDAPFEDSAYVVRRYAERIGLSLEDVELYKAGKHSSVRPVLRDTEADIQVVIPFKDQAEFTVKCVKSIATQSVKDSLEVTLVDNGSSDETLEAVRAAAEQTGLNYKLITVKSYFNFAKLNNAGANTSSAPLILLLNNDVEFNEPDTIKELRRWCMLSDVGVVGGKLYYEDGDVQCASMNFSTRRPVNLQEEEFFTDVVRESNGVTFAMVMMKRSLFSELKGLDEFDCPNGFGDALFCHRVWELGQRVLYTPFASAIHYESKSRKRVPEELEFYEMESHGLPIPDLFADFGATSQPWRVRLGRIEEPPVQKLANHLIQSPSLNTAANRFASGVLQLNRVGRTFLAKRVER